MSTALARLLVIAVTLAPGAAAAPQDLGLASRTVTAVADQIERDYFDAGKATSVAAALRKSLAEGRYENAASREALAAQLTAELRAATHDQHLAVSVTAQDAATAIPVSREERGRHENYGVTRVEILPGNVGVLRIDAFYRLEEARTTLDAAMAVLGRADALVIDLRGNGGGAPDTVAYLASYLVAPDTRPLFEIVPRRGDTSPYPVVRPLPTPANEARPVFALTASRTFSAGEGLAFLLQARGRAEVIGERTAGAANPGRAYPVGDDFEVTIPNGSVRVPGMAGNWEGTGVTPEVPCSANDALRVAHARALRRLAETAPDGAWRDTLRRLAQTP